MDPAGRKKAVFLWEFPCSSYAILGRGMAFKFINDDNNNILAKKAFNSISVFKIIPHLGHLCLFSNATIDAILDNNWFKTATIHRHIFARMSRQRAKHRYFLHCTVSVAISLWPSPSHFTFPKVNYDHQTVATSMQSKRLSKTKFSKTLLTLRCFKWKWALREHVLFR